MKKSVRPAKLKARFSCKSSFSCSLEASFKLNVSGESNNCGPKFTNKESKLTYNLLDRNRATTHYLLNATNQNGVINKLISDFLVKKPLNTSTTFYSS